MAVRTTLTLGLLLAAMSIVAGCVTERIEPASGSRFISNSGSASDVQTGNTDGTNTPIVSTSSYAGRTQFLSLGIITYDRQTLPLVSADGRYIAAETGIAPSMPTLLASEGAGVPQATAIEIHRIIDGEDTGPALESVASIAEGLVLGRSANDRGFVVEAPRPNGARWIGFVDWETGEISWLVRDPYVNAFAALGPGDRLAWSRRAVDAPHFELMVSIGGSKWSFAEDGTNWLFPVWSDQGEGLFAVRAQDDGQLFAVFMRGDSPPAMRQSARTIRLTNYGGVAEAYQMMVGHPAVVGAPGNRLPRLVFVHPEYGRVGVWEPMRAGGAQRMLLDHGSFAAAIDPDGYAIYSAASEFFGRSIYADSERIEFEVPAPVTAVPRQTRIERAWFVPRLTSADEWPILLFAPSPVDPSLLEVVGMKIIPVS